MRETNHEYYRCKKYDVWFAHGKIAYQIFIVSDNNKDITTVTSLFFS